MTSNSLEIELYRNLLSVAYNIEVEETLYNQDYLLVLK